MASLPDYSNGFSHIVLAGLGNPGKVYENTRHNIGFLLLERVANRLGLSWKIDKALQVKKTSYSLPGKFTLHLIAPQTFMNDSGTAVSKVMQYYKIDASALIVAHDDVRLLLGEKEFAWAAPARGQNGLKDIQKKLKGPFATLRLGVGQESLNDSNPISLSSFVLGTFTPAEEGKRDAMLDEASSKLFDMLSI